MGVHAMSIIEYCCRHMKVLRNHAARSRQVHAHALMSRMHALLRICICIKHDSFAALLPVRCWTPVLRQAPRLRRCWRCCTRVCSSHQACSPFGSLPSLACTVLCTCHNMSSTMKACLTCTCGCPRSHPASALQHVSAPAASVVVTLKDAHSSLSRMLCFCPPPIPLSSAAALAVETQKVIQAHTGRLDKVTSMMHKLVHLSVRIGLLVLFCS